MNVQLIRTANLNNRHQAYIPACYTLSVVCRWLQSSRTQTPSRRHQATHAPRGNLPQRGRFPKYHEPWRQWKRWLGSGLCGSYCTSVVTRRRMHTSDNTSGGVIVLWNGRGRCCGQIPYTGAARPVGSMWTVVKPTSIVQP